MKSIVSVVKSNYNDAFVNIKKSLNLIGEPKLNNGDTVVIKINICDARTAETGTITHPLFLDALLRYLREGYQNLNLCVVESDASVVLADKFIKWFGYLPVLDKWNATFINTSKSELITKKIKGRHFTEISIASIFDKANLFITVPKPKINSISTITCCLKNQFGCLPLAAKNIYHPYLDDVIADINIAIPPDLCIVDGIIAMGGSQSPAYGVPIPLNLIICSRDPVATDSFVAKLMGFNPWFIGHIKKSARSGIGSMNYSLIGDKIEKNKINFETSKLELFLLRLASKLQKRTQKGFRTSGRTAQ